MKREPHHQRRRRGILLLAAISSSTDSSSLAFSNLLRPHHRRPLSTSARTSTSVVALAALRPQRSYSAATASTSISFLLKNEASRRQRRQHRRRPSYLMASSELSTDYLLNSQSSLSSIAPTSSSSASTSRFNVLHLHARITSQSMVTQILCPATDEDARNIAAIEAFHHPAAAAKNKNVENYDDKSINYNNNHFDLPTKNEVITCNDPRTEYTYGEFPFDSFDTLMDRAVELVLQQQQLAEEGHNDDDKDDDNAMKRRKITMVDIGSGCGRLVLYAALSRGYNSSGGDNDYSGVGVERTREPMAATASSAAASSSSCHDRHTLPTITWDVHGVEIGKQLHSLAFNSLQRGVECGWFQQSTLGHVIDSFSNGSNINNDDDDDDDDSRTNSSLSQIEFHNSNVLVNDPSTHNNNVDDEDTSSKQHVTNNVQSILSRTNILFAYSTVFETNSITPFNPQIQAMLLAPKWSRTLAQSCPRGCVAITTDRALNPEDGWELLDRIEVANPAVCGSTGYISVLKK